MKNLTTNRSGVVRLITRVLGVLLAIAIMAPVVAFSQSLTPVPLGTAGNFVVLASSLVSNVPTSAITGNVGLSPAAGSKITGLGTTQVTGTIYTVDATGPTGSVTSVVMLDSAQADLTIAYNNAAGRTPVPTGTFLNPGAGNIGGMTLIAGLYKFTSALSITGSDVTLTGSSTDVWIFQIASDLIVGNGIKVTLAGGAQASNIFWQVGSSATLGTTCAFKGTIMAHQSISLNTGASLLGRALASNAAVTLASNAITKPASVTGVKNSLAPETFALLQNYPNPFNPTTKIDYTLGQAGIVSLKVYNVLGVEVATLVNGREAAGTHTVQFNPSEGVLNLASGVYMYRLQSGSFVSTKKLVLIK
ncbi:MAG TPA: ice-binding family protein [Bacteroidota bacterium]|nr:ice-binding family protein [Bacteroidota bacterium]